MTTTIAVADDDLFVREQLHRILSAVPDISLVAMAEDGRQAVDAVISEAPDLTVMDIRMPHLDGVEAAAEILQHHQDARILMFTSYRDHGAIRGSIEAGASGYLLKNEDPTALVHVVRSVTAGFQLFSNSVLPTVISRSYMPENHLTDITEAEREALELLCQGRSNRQMATALHLSESSVKARLASATRKLGATSRAQAAARAGALGLDRR